MGFGLREWGCSCRARQVGQQHLAAPGAGFETHFLQEGCRISPLIFLTALPPAAAAKGRSGIQMELGFWMGILGSTEDFPRSHLLAVNEDFPPSRVSFQRVSLPSVFLGEKFSLEATAGKPSRLRTCTNVIYFPLCRKQPNCCGELGPITQLSAWCWT